MRGRAIIGLSPSKVGRGQVGPENCQWDRRPARAAHTEPYKHYTVLALAALPLLSIDGRAE